MCGPVPWRMEEQEEGIQTGLRNAFRDSLYRRMKLRR